MSYFCKVNSVPVTCLHLLTRFSSLEGSSFKNLHKNGSGHRCTLEQKGLSKKVSCIKVDGTGARREPGDGDLGAAIAFCPRIVAGKNVKVAGNIAACLRFFFYNADELPDKTCSLCLAVFT